MREFLDKTITAIQKKKSFYFLAIPFTLILFFILLFVITSQPRTEDAIPEITSTPPSATPTLTEDQTLQKQDESEREFAEEQGAIRRDYPWYDSLPLQKDNYFVYFDVDSKSFKGLLYPQLSSQVSEENQVAAMKQEINSSLTNLGIDISQYQFDWEINPEL